VHDTCVYLHQPLSNPQPIIGPFDVHCGAPFWIGAIADVTGPRSKQHCWPWTDIGAPG